MSAATTVAVLYPGELGAALARLLAGREARVITTLQDRGPLTVRRCRETGIIVLPSLREVVKEADVVISVVPPALAEAMADAYCRLSSLAPPEALYVDANSIAPGLAAALSARVSECGRGFVDAAINGLAANAAASGTLFLSGQRAGEVARLFEEAMRVQVLGDGPGAASAMKMALGGLAKGLCSLFAEMALLAERHNMLPEMLDASARIYPGVWAVAERMLPTYAVHAARRATEMSHVEETLRSAGIEPTVIRAVREVHQRWAAAPPGPDGGATDRPVESIIRHWSVGRAPADRPTGTTGEAP